MFSDLEMHWWLVNTHSAHFVISTETAIIELHPQHCESSVMNWINQAGNMSW